MGTRWEPDEHWKEDVGTVQHSLSVFPLSITLYCNILLACIPLQFSGAAAVSTSGSGWWWSLNKWMNWLVYLLLWTFIFLIPSTLCLCQTNVFLCGFSENLFCISFLLDCITLHLTSENVIENLINRGLNKVGDLFFWYNANSTVTKLLVWFTNWGRWGTEVFVLSVALSLWYQTVVTPQTKVGRERRVCQLRLPLFQRYFLESSTQNQSFPLLSERLPESYLHVKEARKHSVVPVLLDAVHCCSQQNQLSARKEIETVHWGLTWCLHYRV